MFLESLSSCFTLVFFLLSFHKPNRLYSSSKSLIIFFFCSSSKLVSASENNVFTSYSKFFLSFTYILNISSQTIFQCLCSHIVFIALKINTFHTFVFSETSSTPKIEYHSL
ncbi:hypothetical protein HOB94_06415 [bacterium]|nr:hypothetical protein [bacterium]